MTPILRGTADCEAPLISLRERDAALRMSLQYAREGPPGSVVRIGPAVRCGASRPPRADPATPGRSERQA
ncbi:hypothetical protein GCM10010247_40760 [Streptomyces calvus]|nr:hypothetical protein GCM10010247_40760 [Streptomyces calvus]